MKRVITILLLSFYALFFGEIYVRGMQFLQSKNILNPNNFVLQTNVKGNKIILPANRVYAYENNYINKLDKKIIHTKNSLGFRGGEPSENFDSFLSIVTVGGSTTECIYLSDDKAWPYLLEQELKNTYNNVWVNNAGLDGHSTFGHMLLLEDYLIKLKPKIILFLIGGAEIGRGDLNIFDADNVRGTYASWKNFIVRNIEIVSVLNNVLRAIRPEEIQAGHADVDVTKMGILEIPEGTIKAELLRHKTQYLAGYEKRLLYLIDMSKENGIEPILVTYPTVVGSGVDPSTGVNLETVKLSDSLNGKLYWKTLELYNAVTEDIGKKTDTFVIDLANKLPKDSRYFYDAHHVTNEGARKLSEILYAELKGHLDNKYTAFNKQ